MTPEHTVNRPGFRGLGARVRTASAELRRLCAGAGLAQLAVWALQAKKPNMATLSLVVAAAEGEEPSMRPVLANLHSADNAAAFVAAVAKAAPK